MEDPKTNEINVAKYIIKHTPIGHLPQTVQNLSVVCGEELMDRAEVKTDIVSYQEDHLFHVPVYDGKAIVSKLNKDSEDYYYDQNKKQVNNLIKRCDAVVKDLKKTSKDSDEEKAKYDAAKALSKAVSDATSMLSVINRRATSASMASYKAAVKKANIFINKKSTKSIGEGGLLSSIEMY